MSTDPQGLKALEQEASKYEKEDDFLSALDVYEEIARKGWASAAHLLALGHCYLRNRQRQNARAVWLRALEMEPGNDKLREALEHYFPGWETQLAPRVKSSPDPLPPAQLAAAASAPAPEGAVRLDEGPPPPPPPRFAAPGDATIRVETTTTEQARRPKPIPSRPRPPQPKPEPVKHVTRSEETIQSVRQAEPAVRVERNENRVNWNYVCADAAEGLMGAQ